LYKQAQKNMLDESLWKTVKARYSGLDMVVVDPKDVNFVKSRLEEIDKQLQVIDIDNKYRQALEKGNSYFSQKKFDSANKAYRQALEFHPADALAKKNIHLTDSAW